MRTRKMEITRKEVRKVRSYSEALKLEVVSEIESGKHTSREAGIFYNIPDTTVRDWVKRYGKVKSKNKKVEVVMKDQKEKIQQLESALSDAHLKLKIQEEAIKEACKEQGFEVKKNISTGELKIVKKPKLAIFKNAAK